MGTLKLYTLNLWSGLTYHGLPRMGEYESAARREQRYQALLGDLREKRPDVVFLNEANPLPGYARRMARELSMDFCWHMGVAGLRVNALGLPFNLREGDVILARKGLSLTFLKRRKLEGPGFCANHFSCHFGNMTQAVLARVRLPNGEPLYLCCTHWTAHPALDEPSVSLLPRLAAQWGFPREEIPKTEGLLRNLQEIKRKEAATLLRFLHEEVPKGAKLLVAGDFNSELPWPELKMLTDDGFIPVPRTDNDGFTWDMAENQNLQQYYLPETRKRQPTLYRQLDAWEEQARRDIDHVFVKNFPEGAASAVRCARERDGVCPSDHFGLLAEIRL